MSNVQGGMLNATECWPVGFIPAPAIEMPTPRGAGLRKPKGSPDAPASREAAAGSREALGFNPYTTSDVFALETVTIDSKLFCQTEHQPEVFH